MTNTSTSRFARNKKKEADALETKAAADALKEQRTNLRDKHCARLERAPSEYTYVVTGSCRPKRGTEAHKLRRQSRDAKARAAGKYKATVDAFSPEANKKELEMVVAYLKTEVNPELDPNMFNYASVAPMFDMMIDRAYREDAPNPLERFAMIISDLERQSKKDPLNVIHFESTPRYVVFTLLLSYLQSVRLPPRTPATLTRFHPFFPSRTNEPKKSTDRDRSSTRTTKNQTKPQTEKRR
jgi:hypothetical protein